MPASPVSINRDLPLLAHIYDSGWKFGQANNPTPTANGGHFKKTVPIVNQPEFTYVLNGGMQPFIIELPTVDSLIGGPALAIGDVVTVTEVGPESDGSIIAGGILEDIPERIDLTKPFHELEVQPFIVEAGVAPHFTNYTAATAVETMVKDAIPKTKHLVFTAGSIPATGINAIFDFSNTGTALRVFEECRKMCGPSYFFHVDEQGIVWFGNASLTQIYTVTRGVDYVARKTVAPADKLRNWVPVIGGVVKGSKVPLAATYDDGVLRTGWPIPAPITAPSNVLGTRGRFPHVHITKLLDQTTLNNMATSIGKQLNRRQTNVDLTIRGSASRINLGQVPGASLRYWEPNVNDSPESFVGSGGYSAVYAVTQVKVKGSTQVVSLTDIVT